MTLVWSIPVAAAALATVVVAAAVRPVGDELTALVDDVRALRRLRQPLAAVRAATADSEALTAAYRRRHPGMAAPRPGDSGADPGDQA